MPNPAPQRTRPGASAFLLSWPCLGGPGPLRLAVQPDDVVSTGDITPLIGTSNKL
jgi:hypothetical protein